MEGNSKGDPRRVISNHIASTGFVSQSDVSDLWEILINRYGSTHRIADELQQKISNFPAIKGNDIGDQLNDMYCLCKMVQ